MKTKIDGITHDTETSKKIAEYENGYPRTDLDFIREALYRADDGTLFFAGETGPRMRYAKNRKDGRKNRRRGRIYLIQGRRERVDRAHAGIQRTER